MTHNSHHGFSLMELALTMAVVGIMTFTALPLFTKSEIVNMDSATRRLVEDIRYAQSLSTSTGDAHGFRTVPSTSETTVYEVYNVDTDQPVTSPYDHEPMTEDMADPFPGVSFEEDDHDIQFDVDGMPTFASGDNTVSIVNGDGSTRTVEIVESTGLIQVQEVP